MTQICALIGSPGAKAQLSFNVTRHSTAKRRRCPACEPVLPDPTCHSFPAWFSWSQLGGGDGRSGWERLAGEGRRLWRQVFFWDDHLVPSTDGYTKASGGSPRPLRGSPSQ